MKYKLDENGDAILDANGDAVPDTEPAASQMQARPSDAPTLAQTAPGQYAGSAEISPYDQSMAAIAPKSAQYNSDQTGLLQRIINQTSDLATMPLRTAGAIGAGLGYLAGEYGSTADYRGLPGRLPTGDELRNAGSAFLEAMQRPEESTAQAGGGFGPTVAAGMAADPTTIPSMMVAPGSGVASIVGRGALTGAGLYGAHAAQRYAEGNPQVLTGETGGQILQDIAPTAIPLAFKGLGALGSLPGKFIGEEGMQKGKDILSKLLKAGPMVRKGQEWKGLQEGLSGKINGQDILPLLTKDAHTAPNVVTNYLGLKESVDAGFSPKLDMMENAGISVDKNKILSDVTENMKAKYVGGQDNPAASWTQEARNKSINFVKDALNRHFGNPELQSIYEAAKSGRVQPVEYQLKAGKGNGLLPIRMTANDAAQMEASGGGVYLKNYEPYFATKDGLVSATELNPMNHPMTPRQAQNLKSALYDEAFKRTAEQSLEKETAAKLGGDAARKQLTSAADNATATPNNKALFDVFAEHLKQSKPIYQMEDAMARAERTGGNRVPFSIHALQLYPQIAGKLYGVGKATQEAGQYFTQKSPTEFTLSDILRNKMIVPSVKSVTPLASSLYSKLGQGINAGNVARIGIPIVGNLPRKSGS